MSMTTEYSEEINMLLEKNEAEFKEKLLRRFAGKDGPPLGSDIKWTDVLVFAFSDAFSELKVRWNKVVLDILNDFVNNRIFEVSKGGESLKRLLGTLSLANGITFPDDDELRLKALLSGWLEFISDERFPGPYNLWDKERFFGQHEDDVLTVILRLSASRLSWRGEADKIDKIWSGDYPPKRIESDGMMDDKINDKVIACRSWEIARWTIAQDRVEWLGEKMEELTNRLEKAGWYPGNTYILLSFIVKN
ncbi:MAG: hypothetical protein HQK89_17340 [Nitrospirae bacterium]|nr:hypothetical protein [Nitrospirota bacterium]